MNLVVNSIIDETKIQTRSILRAIRELGYT